MRPSRFVLPLLLVCAAAPAHAQLSLTRTGGALGGPLDYTIAGGEPFDAFVWIPSGTTGPTPLSLFDPLDTRSLEVGIDLFTYWQFGGLSPTGEAFVANALPLNPGLAGITVHAQVVSLPGTTTVVDDLSNRTAVRLGTPGTSVFTVELATLGLSGHTATALPGGDVLLIGGEARDGAGVSQGANRVVRYRHQTGSFEVLPGTLAQGRLAHTATLLADGSVLVVGGTDVNGVLLSTAERIDPDTGTSLATSFLDTARALHTATLLPNGQVLVAGGTTSLDFSDPTAALLAILATTRVFNAGSNSWANGPNLPRALIGHRATRIGDGRVLVSGGLSITLFFGLPIPSFTGDARLYNPVTNTFAAAGSFSNGRAFHAQELLEDGRVLVVGGADGDVLTQTFTTRADTRYYNPGTNSWSNGASIGTARAYGQLVVSPGRSPVLLGGLADVDVTTTSGAPATAIEVLDVLAGTWSSPSSQLLPRPIGAVALTDSAAAPRILTTGEAALAPGSPVDLTAELYIP